MPTGENRPLEDRVDNLGDRVENHDKELFSVWREIGSVSARVARLEERRDAVDAALNDIRAGIAGMRGDVQEMHNQNIAVLGEMARRIDSVVATSAKAEATAEATHRSAKVVLKYAWSAFIGVVTPAALFGGAMVALIYVWEVFVGFLRWLGWVK